MKGGAQLLKRESGKEGSPFQGAPLISVVVPCFNEEEVIEQTHARLSCVLRELDGCGYEIVYVNDGSTDSTAELLAGIVERDPRVRVVRFGRNFGHQAGVFAGLKAAAGDAVVMIDADLQDPPEVIVEMVAQWRAGWRIVTGRRLSRNGESLFKKWTAFCFYRALWQVADHPVALDTGDFRLLDRAAVDAIISLPENQLYLRGVISWTGLSETVVEFVRAPRAAGETKYTLKKMIRLSRQGLISTSSMPLRLPMTVGLASLAAAAAAKSVRRRQKFSGAAAQFGLQALLTGVLAEYLQVVHEQVRGRPPYIVEDVMQNQERRSAELADGIRRVS
ncbi:glycosyltransferase family 2 protein [Amycolatopsis sp. NPDC059021]|uniref:glycosyltransferase family 2 protein n=1 Tax=Amycolatopsis sp. NPDC059021 TaxID=3346704 RepID=UPI00366FFE22